MKKVLIIIGVLAAIVAVLYFTNNAWFNKIIGKEESDTTAAISDKEIELLDKGFNEEEIAQILNSPAYQDGNLTV